MCVCIKPQFVVSLYYKKFCVIRIQIFILCFFLIKTSELIREFAKGTMRTELNQLASFLSLACEKGLLGVVVLSVAPATLKLCRQLSIECFQQHLGRISGRPKDLRALMECLRANELCICHFTEYNARTRVVIIRHRKIYCILQRIYVTLAFDSSHNHKVIQKKINVFYNIIAF